MALDPFGPDQLYNNNNNIYINIKPEVTLSGA